MNLKNRWQLGTSTSVGYVVGVIVLSAFLLIALPLFTSFSISSARNKLEDNGYIVLAAGEYSTLNTKLDNIKTSADLAVVNAQAAVIAAREAAETVLADLHAKQLVYPELAAPITLPALGGGAWAGYGALTQVVPINAIASNFTVHGVSISGMDANADYTVRIAYGAGDTEWGIFAITRGGIQTASTVIDIQGTIIPANSIVKMQVADSIGTSTLAVKLIYHLTEE